MGAAGRSPSYHRRKPGQPLSREISSSRSTLQAVAVDTPVVSRVGGQLVQVSADDVGLGHGADGVQQLQKADTAGLRRAGPREQEGSRQSRSMVR